MIADVMAVVQALPRWVVYGVGVAHGVILATAGVEAVARVWVRLRRL